MSALLRSLAEGKKSGPKQAPQTGEWGFTFSPLFQSSLTSMAKTFPDLQSRVERFINLKKPNPTANMYGKHDRPMTGPLIGLWHTHLRDDAVLIYLLKNRCIHLVCIVPHSEIEGRRLQATRTRLKSAGELPEGLDGLADRIVEAMMGGPSSRL